jgi:pescadillo protein
LKPDFNLNHLVKERYPRFIDALRDLDDALCMIHMIASLPSQGRVVAEKTLACQELALHWQYYVAKSKCLKKVFVSVKGIYFQAEIMSESITWLTPHQFTQAFPGDVDFRVIMTFLDFYEVYLRFVLFKLYNLQGLQYPPTVDQSLNEAGCCLLSVRSIPIDSSENTQPLLASLELDKKQNQASQTISKTSAKKKNDIASLAKIASLEDKFDSILEHSIESNDSQSTHQNDLISPLATVFSDLHSNDYTEDDNLEENKAFVSTSTDEPSKLFANLKFFINREVPLQWLQLSCVSFGGQVGWSGPGSPFDESDDGITHHIIDRPIFGVPLKSRDYIQPQWVFDSINAKLLLPVHKYKPGVILPPHLSPFVDDFKEGYLPKYREEILTLQSAVSANSGAQINLPTEVDNASSTSSSEDEKANKTNKKKEAKGGNKKKIETLTHDPPNNNSAKTKGPKAVIFEPAQQKISEVRNHIFILYSYTLSSIYTYIYTRTYIVHTYIHTYIHIYILCMYVLPP